MTLLIAALYVATYVDIQLSSTSQGVELIRQYRDKTRAEAGSSGVDVIQEIGRPNHFVIFGTGKDRNAFDAHEAKAHTKQFRETVGPMLGAPYDERLYSPLN